MSSHDGESVRLFHFSDIHLAVERPGWRLGDYLNKRLPGWLNARYLGRGKEFEGGARVIGSFLNEIRAHHPDCLVFSGDATGLGFEKEMANAAAILKIADSEQIPAVAVPGNHDYYTRAAAASGAFERYFAPWQQGKRVDDAVYPFARRVGPLWLIAVNSCTGNRWFWDAAGSVGTEQLRRLETLFGMLDPGLRILVTHYPICLSSGKPEHRFRGLRDLDDLLAVAKRGRACLWLHGHRHTPYHHARSALADFPIICAGSTTKEGTASYGEYTITGHHLSAIRRAFTPDDHIFHEVERFDLELPQL